MNSQPALIALVCMLYVSIAPADQQSWSLSLETGGVWQSRNDVRIPNDTGTRFAIDNITESGPFAYYRLESSFDLDDDRQLRLLLAPLRISESGVTDQAIEFDGETFSAGQRTDFTYQFNSYRVSYRWLYKQSPDWRLWLGATLKLRDAGIALQQGSVRASDDNVGLVPLFHLYSDYRLDPQWRFVLDFDGLVGPQGRALDLGLNFQRDLDKNWYLGFGYRTLEGGADNDDVYSFAWLNYAFFSLGYRP